MIKHATIGARVKTVLIHSVDEIQPHVTANELAKQERIRRNGEGSIFWPLPGSGDLFLVTHDNGDRAIYFPDEMTYPEGEPFPVTP